MDTKSDPFQIPIGKFSLLKNKIFSKAGRLDKRNGFGSLTALSDSSNTLVSTFNNNLIAVGNSVNAYSSASATWANKGDYYPLEISALPLVRNSTSQISCDSATHSNGLVCVVYTDNNPSAVAYKYTILNSITGQVVVNPTALASCDGSPRVFVLDSYFIILYPVSAAIKYIAISVNAPSSAGSATNLATVYSPGANAGAYDACVVNNRLFLAYNATDVGGAIRITYLTNTLTQGGTTAFAGESAELMSICADDTQPTPVIYMVYYESATPLGDVIAVDFNVNTVLTATAWNSTDTILNVACAAQDGSVTIFYEVENAYSYDAAIATNYIVYKTVSSGGSVGSATTLKRSVGLASKAFIYDSTIYVCGVYQSSYQPTIFLLDSSGNIHGKLAYSNASGYLTYGLPSITVNSTVADMSYLLKTVIIPTNKDQNADSSTPVFSQLGVNLCHFDFDPSLNVVEIGSNLELSGGFVWQYDGVQAVEQGFHIYPDNVEATWSTTGGSIAAQPDGSTNTNAYYYVALYEWTDNQGNIYRSAPSVPVAVTTTGTGNTGSITVDVPYLRLTAKTTNPVKIVIYRWSVQNQIFYQVTSVSAPTLNSTSSDAVAFVDTLADASIIGNSIVYTTGGVLENIGAPASSAMALFKSRLFLISSESPNTLWFSKQVVGGTPVEMSDLLTLYVAPTTAAQGSTGPLKCLAPMDDKLILFKKNSLFYIVGTGPDNTGANNDFSEPVFITSTVGCDNQSSIVFQPQGLMFESDKGIWILRRDLGTEYIGAPVEDYTTDATVLSAINVPGTNQVRFNMSSGFTLMYDYFFQQWSVFEGVNAISSTVYNSLPTIIDQYGRAFQETNGAYIDGSKPVLIQVKTGWINVAGLQGYERAYFMYLLGTYKSPHKLQVDIAYDYNSSPTQSTTITPDNYNAVYGDSDGNYGDESPYGGNTDLEKWRIFFKNQKCEAFQVTITETYDSSFGIAAGEGLTLSGLNLVVGVKSGYPRRSAEHSVG